MHFVKRHHIDRDKLFHQSMVGFECRNHIASQVVPTVEAGARIDGNIRNYSKHFPGECPYSFGTQGLSETHHK